MNLEDHPRYLNHLLTRRRFLRRTSAGIGMAAVASILDPQAFAATSKPASNGLGILGAPHFAPKAKRVIYLFQGGGPSHVELFDHKPILETEHGKDVPPSVLGTQRVTLMTRSQAHFYAATTPYKWKRYGQAGIEMSELLPHIGSIADELCLLRTIHSDPINHDPAVTFMQTGFPQPGLPCMGSWLSYGLGSENHDLPSFVVFLSGPFDQPIPSRYYHSGFLPSQHQGVQFQPGSDPVLYLSNPHGITGENRGRLIGDINKLNELKLQQVGDPEIEARINSFELAFRMQTSVPELMNTKSEPQHILDMYGPDVNTPGSYARHCLLARRLIERGTRFVQLFHRGWDQHADVTNALKRQTEATDRASAALVKDLKDRGLLDETLIIWGGEFGRTAYGQGDLKGAFGRDHHPRCFSVWMAGGGVKGGTTYGATDDYGYNIAADPVDVHDFHATILHLLGIDHERLTYNFKGRNFRLTDVSGKIVSPIVA